ncbi:MAG TPA: cytochrome P450, partial [Polyangiaceae bacterium]|nr:cytochrome P450 [Polyangiaceae bacterium]
MTSSREPSTLGDAAPRETQAPQSQRVSGTRRRLRQPTELPYPPRVPGLGNAHQISWHRLHQNLEDWAHTYGCPYQMQLGRRKFVVFDDPEVTATVLESRPDVFQRYSLTPPSMRRSGTTGVFNAEGDEWRSQRRLAMAALAERNLGGFFGPLRASAERLLLRWQQAADLNDSIDVQRELLSFTADVTSFLTFGRDSNTLAPDDAGIQRHLRTIREVSMQRLSALVPYWRVLRLPADRALDRARSELSEWLGHVIREAYGRLEHEPARKLEPQNLVEAMLVARDERGEAFDESLIRDNLLTMLLSGEDTTANTIAWVIHELLESRKVTQRLADEADRVLGSDCIPRDLALAGELTYAEAVATETLRLRPVVPFVTLTAARDTVLEDVAIERGTHVTLLLRAIAKNPDFVPEPSRFFPERWLDRKAVSDLQRRSIHVPFGSGPRLCPGRGLALLEIRLVLGSLYKNFKIERVGRASDVKEHLAFSMGPQNLRIR